MASKQCTLCELNILQQSSFTCDGCQAVLYCSENCQGEDFKGTDTSQPHQQLCKSFKSYMENETTLCQFPFTFSSETTSREFEGKAYKEYLMRHGVYNLGYWRRECMLDQKGKPFIPFGDLPDDGHGYVLEDCFVLLSAPLKPPSSEPPLMDWAEYYRWRGITLGSPLAILLSYPLTVYYILTTCLRMNDSNYYDGMMSRKNLHIVLVGIEKEVEMIPVLRELAFLMPHKHIHIDIVSKSISRKVNKKAYHHGNMTVTVYRKLYHKWETDSQDVIIGLNAGIAAYISWQPTIRKLQEQGIPSYFTDYCEYFVDITDKTLREAGMGGMSCRHVNPFRSPVRIVSKDNYLPCFSNCMIFGLNR